MATPGLPQGLEPTPAQPNALLAFAQLILRSGLLTREQLQSAISTLPAGQRGDPRALAEHLIKDGQLTGFQARKLLEGTHIGLVLGPFHVLAPIGKGGMGTVYMARDTRNRQLLALKILPPKRAREEDRMLARFQREMQMSQRVAHPNLTQTYEVGDHLGVHYIAMEYIPGVTLYRLINEQGPLTVPRAAHLFAQVAAGLENAHAQGLIHRDLKPSNIMIMPNDHAKVLDLGLALVQNEVISDRSVVGGQGYIVGTMDYIAPEQAADPTKVDRRSDVYSLGCALYFALTGQPPFPGGTTMQKIKRHHTEEPVPVAKLNPTVPAEFQAVLQRLMAKRPDRRLPTAEAARKELLAWAPNVPAAAVDLKGEREYEQTLAAQALAKMSPEQYWQEVVGNTSSLLKSGTGRGTSGAILPFWLDYLVPVGVCLALLSAAWILGLKFLLVR